MVWLNKKGTCYNICKGCVFLKQNLLKRTELFDLPHTGEILMTRTPPNMGFVDGNLSSAVLKDLIWFCEGSKTPDGCPQHMKELINENSQKWRNLTEE